MASELGDSYSMILEKSPVNEDQSICVAESDVQTVAGWLAPDPHVVPRAVPQEGSRARACCVLVAHYACGGDSVLV